jgi:hypothetical protein
VSDGKGGKVEEPEALAHVAATLGEALIEPL